MVYITRYTFRAICGCDGAGSGSVAKALRSVALFSIMSEQTHFPMSSTKLLPLLTAKKKSLNIIFRVFGTTQQGN